MLHMEHRAQSVCVWWRRWMGSGAYKWDCAARDYVFRKLFMERAPNNPAQREQFALSSGKSEILNTIRPNFDNLFLRKWKNRFRLHGVSCVFAQPRRRAYWFRPWVNIANFCARESSPFRCGARGHAGNNEKPFICMQSDSLSLQLKFINQPFYYAAFQTKKLKSESTRLIIASAFIFKSRLLRKKFTIALDCTNRAKQIKLLQWN